MELDRALLYHGVDSFYQFVKSLSPVLWSFINCVSSCLVDILRVYSSRCTAHNLAECNRPNEPIQLYEFEGCPYCRKVRETLCHLNIDHVVYPCPRETLVSAGVCLNSRYRQVVKQSGGVCMFPYIMDPNTDVKLYNSDEIIQYLWKTYGSKASPTIAYRLAFFPPYLNVSLFLVGILRSSLDMGILRAASRSPKETLEFWGVEASGCSRKVREVLAMLELPYLYHVMPFGADEKRKEFAKAHASKTAGLKQLLGFLQLPYLKDPNTNVELSDANEIVQYLKTHYQTAPVPAETWKFYNKG